MADAKYDRSTEDVGNILALEHVNVRVPDQVMATTFYIVGMGFTRDPYVQIGINNMWANVGQEQFHLPTARPQVLRGVVGVVVPDLDALGARLGAVKDHLAGTRFAYRVEDDHVLVTCPWGNRLRCHAPAPAFGDVTLGIAYVEFPVPRGHAAGIRRFYAAVMGTPGSVHDEAGGPVARVRVGYRQQLVFRETSAELAPYDGHHLAIYVANFSGPHAFLAKHGLVTEESDQVQYRFEEIVDPDTREPLFRIEHEVRSASHPMYLRPLVNRNPGQRQATYRRGRDAFYPGLT